MIETALAAQGLSKRYDRRRPAALDGIDLEVARGSITALVGPNGAGKSTLMKAWVAFERPTSGRVTVGGIDPWRQRSAALAQLGYIPQSPALYSGLSVRDHLVLAGQLRPGFDHDRAVRRLDDLAIPRSASAGTLSGGQRAQLMLALVLASRAPILLLDEPLASLDPLARREFLYLLATAVRADGTTALVSSHVVTDVEQACDRLVVLGEGRKLLDADIATALSTHALLEGQAAGGEQGLVASFPGPRGEILSLLRVGRGEPPPSILRPATLEELVLGYLAAGRPGMMPRIAAGVAGR